MQHLLWSWGVTEAGWWWNLLWVSEQPDPLDTQASHHASLTFLICSLCIWTPSKAGSGPSLGCHQGDEARYCCMEILLKLNWIKGQLCPDKNRKPNCTRLLDSMYHMVSDCFREFGLLTSRIVFHVSCFSSMRFIYPVGGKEQYGTPVCFSLKSFHFWRSHHCCV